MPTHLVPPKGALGNEFVEPVLIVVEVALATVELFLLMAVF